MKAYLVPFGTRCNSAIIVNSILSQPRLPFDWTQMNVLSMKKVLELERSDIESFWDFYFSDIDERHYNNTTGSWFPHDKFTSEELIKTKEKYIRRTQRLFTSLESDIPKVFIIFFGFPTGIEETMVKLLLSSANKRSKAKNIFIVCNGKNEELVEDNVYYIFENLSCSAEEKDESWDRLTKVLAEKIKILLTKLEIEPIPIPT